MATSNDTRPSEPDAFPLFIHGDWSATDLAQRLARGGLTLTDVNGDCWLVRHHKVQDAPQPEDLTPADCALLQRGLAVVLNNCRNDEEFARAEALETRLKTKHEAQAPTALCVQLDPEANADQFFERLRLAGLELRDGVLSIGEAADPRAESVALLRTELAVAKAEAIVYKREAQQWQDQAREAQRELGACRAALASLTHGGEDRADAMETQLKAKHERQEAPGCTCTVTEYERQENRSCPVHFPRGGAL